MLILKLICQLPDTYIMNLLPATTLDIWMLHALTVVPFIGWVKNCQILQSTLPNLECAVIQDRFSCYICENLPFLFATCSQVTMHERRSFKPTFGSIMRLWPSHHLGWKLMTPLTMVKVLTCSAFMVNCATRWGHSHPVKMRLLHMHSCIYMTHELHWTNTCDTIIIWIVIPWNYYRIHFVHIIDMLLCTSMLMKSWKVIQTWMIF